MADAKWIPNLSCESLLHDAARRVLQARLQVVGQRLPQAIEQAEDDIEHVHQLRVATRRATAALQIFGECLPDKAFRRVRKALRRIRRAAGDARDWDVFLEMIAERGRRTQAAQKAGIAFLHGYGQGRRAAAQQELLDLRDSTATDFPITLADTLTALRPSTATLRERAAPAIANLVRDFESAMHQDLSHAENLHPIRILGKKLRYSMEIFASCFEPAFKSKSYPAVEEMQEILGDVNDSVVAARRLQEIARRLSKTQPAEYPRVEPGLTLVLRFHQRRLPTLTRRFQEWWKTWQQRLIESLARPTRL